MTTRFALDKSRGAGRFNTGGRPARDAQWEESKHPRAKNGEFGSGGGGAAPKSESTSSGAGVKSNASAIYSAPTKSADQIINAIPGAMAAVEKVRQKLGAGVTTNSLVKDGGFMQENGSYTPERQAIHKKIIDSFINAESIKKYTPQNGEKPTLTILGGRGGSGKSWFTKPNGIIDTNKSLLLDSDKIKEALPGYEGWNAAHLHEESSHIAGLIDRRAAKLGMNVILDGTLKSTDSIMNRVATFQGSHDYDLVGRYMYTSPETAASRAFSRFAKDGKFNGRFVPPEVILSNTKNEQNFDMLSPKFKEWSLYDNNGTEPKLVSEHKPG
jgi:predicted ABC-type ATPase